MIAILQLKASKHFVYFVSIAVVTFTLLGKTSIIRGFWDQNLVRQVPPIIEVWLYVKVMDVESHPTSINTQTQQIL